MKEGREVTRDPRAQKRGLLGKVQWDGIHDLVVSPSSVLEPLLPPERVLRNVDGTGDGQV